MPPPPGEKYLDAKTIERIKRLDVRARLVVEGFMTGPHQSPYHGLAVEFAGHREYAPGDEIKHIDWKLWSRTDRLYIKEYEEETNLTCTLLLDCSKSMRYARTGSRWSKFDYAATAAASLAYLMQHQQDAVGLITFYSKIDRSIPARSHLNHFKLLLHELEQTRIRGRTDVGQVFSSLARHTQKRGLIVLISDLLVDLPTLADALQQFRLRRHEILVFQVLHNDELTFPFGDHTLFRSLEGNRQLHTDPRALRRSYLEHLHKYLSDIRGLCGRLGVDYLLMNTKDPLDALLARYLTFRQRTRRRIAGRRR